jgi:hypothetical protein
VDSGFGAEDPAIDDVVNLATEVERGIDDVVVFFTTEVENEDEREGILTTEVDRKLGYKDGCWSRLEFG